MVDNQMAKGGVVGAVGNSDASDAGALSVDEKIGEIVEAQEIAVVNFGPKKPRRPVRRRRAYEPM